MTLPGFPTEVIDSVLLGSTCSVCGGMVKQNWVTASDHKTDVLNLNWHRLLLINYSPVKFIVCICLLKATDSEYLLSEYLS